MKLPNVPRETFHMKQISKKGNKNRIGAIGELVAVKYLEEKGFSILEVNYLKKCGEIDIVARETDKIHFVEVKTVSYGTKNALRSAVSYGTYRPEENVHYSKVKRIYRTIESWVTENNYEGEWEVDVIAVRMVPTEKYATVKYLPSIVVG